MRPKKSEGIKGLGGILGKQLNQSHVILVADGVKLTSAEGKGARQQSFPLTTIRPDGRNSKAGTGFSLTKEASGQRYNQRKGRNRGFRRPLLNFSGEN